MKLTLTAAEKLFCCHYAELGNITEAAAASGFPVDTAYETAAEILSRPSARRLIRSQRSFIREKGIDDIRTALRRIAFGEANDAVRLALCEDDTLPLNRMNFFGISELKKVKGGGIELKFTSRLDALKMLCEIENGEFSKNRADSFLSAFKNVSCNIDGEDDVLE